MITKPPEETKKISLLQGLRIRPSRGCTYKANPPAKKTHEPSREFHKIILGRAYDQQNLHRKKKKRLALRGFGNTML